jgi:hypothetical protein
MPPHKTLNKEIIYIKKYEISSSLHTNRMKNKKKGELQASKNFFIFVLQQ